jgi:hypothetical protein
LAVTSNALPTELATVHCGAMRGTAPVDVGSALKLHPNDFPAGGGFRSFDVTCAWLPDDVGQFVEISGFAVGVTDLSVDYLRVVPLVKARGPWDGAEGTSENHAFCASPGGGYSLTRYQAANTCKQLGMRLCTVAELGAYAEADYASCCYGWLADPGSNNSPTSGKMGFLMYSSATTNTIAGGCGGNPGGLRISDNVAHTSLYSAHCCK